MFYSVKEIIECYTKLGLGKNERRIFKGVIFVACWCIWKARNNKIFNHNTLCSDKVFHDIKALGFLWYRSRLELF